MKAVRRNKLEGCSILWANFKKYVEHSAIAFKKLHFRHLIFCRSGSLMKQVIVHSAVFFSSF